MGSSAGNPAPVQGGTIGSRVAGTRLGASAARRSGPTSAYLRLKRGFDLLGALVLVPPLALLALVLLCVNPWLNPGPLFFVQERMGRGCQPFRAWKFRTMRPAPEIARGPFDALETDRIPPLGHRLRAMRLDELPQVLNVLKGEMSLIGPRPDYHPHALAYLDTVPGYRERHAMTPGISGLAQTEVGYADGPEGVRAKVAADLHYLRHASLKTDLWITWRTLAVVLGCHGK